MAPRDIADRTNFSKMKSQFGIATTWRTLIFTVLALWLTMAIPAAAQSLSLSQVSEAAQRGDLPVLRQALGDPQLAGALDAIDPEASTELYLAIGSAFDQAGDKTLAVQAYDKAVAAIAKAHAGHDDLTMVDILRKTAALRRDLRDLSGAVNDIDRAFAIATDAKHPALREVTVEYNAIRQAFAAANPAAKLPEPYVPRGAGQPPRGDPVSLLVHGGL